MGYFEDIRKVAELDLPWEKLSGKNILITGATGLIGSTLVQTLMSRSHIDYYVYASGRSEEKINTVFRDYVDNPNFKFIRYDVRETLDRNIDFHVIIAGAGVASPQFYATDPVSVIKSNIFGVDNLMQYGIRHHLERFLYVSSGEIYGEGDGRVFSEDYSGYVDCATLRACYSSAKRATESLCIAYGHQYDIDVRIVRPCHVYGPNFTTTDKRVYAQFIRNVLNDEDIVMKSTGAQYRSWCYVVDCVSAMLYVLLDGETLQAYNIADETSNITIRELAEMIAGIGGRNVVMKLPDDIEKIGYNVVTKSLFTTDKIKALGWSVSGDMKTKMSNTINAIKY